MKRFLTVVFLVFSFHVYGASVLWNEGFSFTSVSLPGEGRGGCSLVLDMLLSDHDIYCAFDIDIEKVGNGWLRRIFGSGMDIGRESWYVIANVGDEINAETTKVPSKVFFSNARYEADDNVKPEYMGNTPWTLYLGLETTGDGDIVGSMRKVYGWVELFVDDYTLTLGNTCLDLSGRPVIVGVRPAEPIPEPATGALALLGAALLFRRRRTFPQSLCTRSHAFRLSSL